MTETEGTRDADLDPATDAADERGDASASGEVSQGPSAFPDAETSAGGADAVPDTPDVTADGDT